MLRKSLLDLRKGFLKAPLGCPYVKDAVEGEGEFASREADLPVPVPPTPPPWAQGIAGGYKGPLPASIAGRSQLPGLAV